MTGKRVLVTGGAGFIGSHCAARFARAGADVRILDDLSTGSRSNVAAAWKLFHAPIADPRELREAVAGCDVVVHLAAFTSVPESFERHVECHRSNVMGSYDVFSAALEAGVGRVVFASSSSVYGELPDGAKSESERPDPISPYALSKLEGEHLLQIFEERHGLSSAALRFFNVYGPRQPADSDYAAAIPIFFERSLRGRALTVYGDGSQTRDFVFVEDVADAVFQAAQSRNSGVFNVGSGEPSAILDLAESIQKQCDARAEIRFAPRRSGDLMSSTADTRHSRDTLGWSAATPLSRGLAATHAWQRTRQGVAGA